MAATDWHGSFSGECSVSWYLWPVLCIEKLTLTVAHGVTVRNIGYTLLPDFGHINLGTVYLRIIKLCTVVLYTAIGLIMS